MRGLLEGGNTAPKTGGLMPSFGGSDDQPEQSLESALKTKREKMAQDKLGIAPEEDASV